MMLLVTSISVYPKSDTDYLVMVMPWLNEALYSVVCWLLGCKTLAS